MTLRSAAAVIALAVLPLAACADEKPAADPGVIRPPAAAGQPGVVDLGRGRASQDALEGRFGQQVRVTGEVATIISPNAFTIGGDEIGENPILVVGTIMPLGIEAGERVQVTGTVKEFQVPGYEQDLDLDLIDQEYEDFDGDPAIQADSVSEV